MALSGSVTTSSWSASDGTTRNYTLSWTATQSVANNTSTVKWTLKATGSYAYNVAERTLKAVVAGTTVYSKTDRVMRSPSTISSGTVTVTHSSTGTASFTVSLQAAVYVSSVNCTGSKTFTLDTIPRQATLSSAPNFNDEGNPAITYSNPAGSAVTSLQACIANTAGSVVYVPYRDISKTGTSYTFSLTTAERDSLRNACTTANSMSVKFYVKTVIGGSTFYSTLTKTLSIVNATPTITASAKDTNATALALTGDESKVIKGYNSVEVAMTATALKGATITNSYITNNGKIHDITSGTINNVENGSFEFFAQDSRGNTVTKTITLNVVNYVTLTANVEANMTVDGVITARAKGNYFNNTFGSVANTLEVEYRYKPHGGTYGSWISTTEAKSENTYTADFTITELDYKNKYVVQVRAKDKLATKESVEITLTCLPVFDWSGNDFNFNVPVNIDGDLNITGQLTYGGGSGGGGSIFDLIYPVGSIYMSVAAANPSSFFGGTWVAWGSGRVPVGVNTSDSNFSTVEKTGGASTHTLTVAQIPSHSHTNQYYDGAGNGTWGYDYTNGKSNTSSATPESGGIGYTGGGAAHNNLQPYITCYMWKRTA